MAKKKSEDFRDLIIDAINNTNNFAILRGISDYLVKKPFSINISVFEFHSMLKECLDEMGKCLNGLKSQFIPYLCMRNITPSAYFKKLETAYLAYSDFEEIPLYEPLKLSLKKELNEAKDDGDMSLISKYTEALDSIDDKYAILEDLIENHIKDKETIFSDYFNGKTFLDINAIMSLTFWNNGLKLKKINMEDVIFYEILQESIRNFICSLFLSNKNSNQILSIAKSPLRFLCSYDGKVIVDFEHVSLLYDYLVSVDSVQKEKVKGVLYYLGMERIYYEVQPFITRTTPKSAVVKVYPNMFGVIGRQSGYNRQYMAELIVPKGYKGYIFEPKNLLQQAFMSSIIPEESVQYIDSMVDKYTESQKIMRQHKNGLFFSFLDKDIESKIMPMILKGEVPLQYMRGKHASILQKEIEDRRKKFSDTGLADSSIDVYSKVVLPFSLEVLGSYIRQFCGDFAKGEMEKDIFIYYMNSHSIGIAVSEDVDEDALCSLVGENFMAALRRVERPTVKEIIDKRLF